MKKFLCLAVFVPFLLVASVQESPLPLLQKLEEGALNKKMLAADQLDVIGSLLERKESKLRVVSFNMLFNHYDDYLEEPNRWVNRKERVAQLVEHMQPDVMGTQELQYTQLQDLLEGLGNLYGYVGFGKRNGEREGDVDAVFYRKDRVTLLSSAHMYASLTPSIPSPTPFGKNCVFVVCHFRQNSTGNEFVVINTHLTYGHVESREYEARSLVELVEELGETLPIIVTGDFNTFPFRPESKLPFYDGDYILNLIKGTNLRDAMEISALGHLGALSSTNFSETLGKAFVGLGTPGVILDHIFVSRRISVLAHAIVSARVDGHFPSDHFPVLADLLL